MAKKSNLIKSKTLYSVKNKHSVSNNGIIYENDLVTIIPSTTEFDDEVTLFPNSNFKYRVRSEENNKKKHVRGEFIANDNGEWWQLSDLSGTTSVSEESKIVLKPNYTSLKDFAYYGSAVELIRATVNDIILHFPGGISYYGSNAPTITIGNTVYYMVSNEFNIDCWSDMSNVSLNSIKNPMKYLSLSYTNYVDKDGGELTKPFINITSSCVNSIIGTVTIDGTVLHIYNSADGKKLLLTNNREKTGCLIKPKQNFIDEFWSNIDDFTRVLLNRNSTPIYSATFETPFFTEDGYFYEMKSYAWPTVGNDNFTPDLTTSEFQTYITSLISLATYHDERDFAL